MCVCVLKRTADKSAISGDFLHWILAFSPVDFPFSPGFLSSFLQGNLPKNMERIA